MGTDAWALRNSLAQEIAETLSSRGYWVPKNTSSSDLIGAVGMALDNPKSMDLKTLSELLVYLDDATECGSADVQESSKLDFTKLLYKV
ncbi:MAG: hypothetical protein ACYSWP_11130, partial [Planctomycetota bacterium]